MKLLFNKKQQKLLKDCIEANKEPTHQWYLINIVFPLVVIISPLLAFFSNSMYLENIIHKILLNGSFSLVGINILFFMLGFLIEKTNIDDKTLEKDIADLKKRLYYYGFILSFVGATLFYFQVTYSNWKINEGLMYVTLIIVFGILLISIQFGKYMFIMKEEFISKARDLSDNYSSDIRSLASSINDLEE